MKNIIRIFLIPVIAICVIVGCAGKRDNAEKPREFVKVRDGEFYIGDSLYRFVGANFWYGALLHQKSMATVSVLPRNLTT